MEGFMCRRGWSVLRGPTIPLREDLLRFVSFLSLSLHSSFLQVVWLFLLFVILETKEENKKEKKKRRRNQPKKKAERRRKKKEKQDG